MVSHTYCDRILGKKIWENPFWVIFRRFFGQKIAILGLSSTVGVPAHWILVFKRTQSYFPVSHTYCDMILGKKIWENPFWVIFRRFFGQKIAKNEHFLGLRSTVGVPATWILVFKRAQSYFLVSHTYCERILEKKSWENPFWVIFRPFFGQKIAKNEHFWVWGRLWGFQLPEF